MALVCFQKPLQAGGFEGSLKHHHSTFLEIHRLDAPILSFERSYLFQIDDFYEVNPRNQF